MSVLGDMTSGAFQGIAPPNVNTTQSTTTQAPAQYLGYLSALGDVGTQQMNTPAQQMVAPLSTLQKDVFGSPSGVANTESLLTGAMSPLNIASKTVGADQINNYLNPYIGDVNNALATSTAQNINQNILPSLQAMGASSGNMGSSRLTNATGQTLANIQSGLGAQQSQNLSTGYKDALAAALQEQQNLGTIGSQNMTSTIAGLNAASGLGAQAQAQNQAIIDAPLKTAGNAAALIKGLTIPTSTTQTYSGPASSYGPSPLSQVAGLASLFAAPSGGTSAYQGIKQGINDIFGSGAPIDLTGFKIPTPTWATGATTPDTTTSLGSGNFTIPAPPASTDNSPTIANANTALGSGNNTTYDLSNLWGNTLLR